MGYFLLRRLALVIPVLLLVSFATFSLQRVEEGSTLRISSYTDWLGKMSHGDLGRSALRHRIPVGEAISNILCAYLDPRIRMK